MSADLTAKNDEITNGRQLVSNTVWNFTGLAVPMLVALFAIPLLIKGLGTERFGVLTLAWMVVGYFSFFDMGIGRATTKFVAEHIAQGDIKMLPPLIWTSIIMLLGLGLMIGLVASLLTPWLVSHVFNIPANLAYETRKSFYLLSISIPLVLGTAGTRGVLEGLSRFGLVNAIKIPTNVAIIIAPVFVLPFSDNLYPITAVLVASRALAFLSYFYLCFHFLPGLKKLLRPNATHIKKLLNFGSWLTVTSIVGSLMALGYVDRFLIGSMLTINSVTYYVTPFEIVTKLWAIPISMVGVMFPVFSAYTISHKEKLHALHQVAIKYILLILTPIVIAIIVLAKPFLRIWLGPAFPPQSALVLQILAVGVLMNAVGHVPYIAIQSLGRPDLTAKRHLWELPFYLIIMWYFIKTMGIIGAAATWLLWTVIDAVLLFQMVKAVMPRTQVSQKFHKWRLIAVIGTLFLLAYLSSIFPNIYLKIGLLTIILLTAIGLGWTLMIDNLEKTYIKDFIVRLWQKMI